MSFYSNAQKKVYVNLHGKDEGGKTADVLQWRIKDGNNEVYADTIGPVTVTGLQYREARDKNHKNQYLVHLKSRDGKIVVMQLSEGSNYTHGVLNVLYGLKTGQLVKFFCKFGANKENPANPYYNVYVLNAANDEWIKGPLTKDDVPAIEFVQVGDQNVKNDLARRTFFKALAEKIANRLSAGEFNAEPEEAPAIPQAKPMTPTEAWNGLNKPAADLYGAPSQPAAAATADDDDLPF